MSTVESTIKKENGMCVGAWPNKLSRWCSSDGLEMILSLAAAVCRAHDCFSNLTCSNPQR